jgi:hypothetical protein
VNEFEKSNPRTHAIYSILIVAALIHEISLWMIQQLLHSGTISSPPSDSGLIVQHCIFGGVLLLETHPQENPALAFVDLQGEAWVITLGWLLFKFAEGPEGMPFLPEIRFQKRRAGVVKKIGGKDGGLESFE